MENTKYEQEVKEYFSKKAEGYDNVEKQKYWILSDKLLWTLFKKQLDSLQENFIFLDVGGGTGRWSKKILENYPNARGTLIDLSEDMLNQAKNKNTFNGRWTICQGNAQNLPFQENSFDLVINTHNVLGFVENADLALKNMNKVLKINGKLISVIPNVYHGIFFNIFQSNIEGAKELIGNSRGKFVSNMPEIDMFSPEDIKSRYKKLGFHDILCLGFPICIYPGYQETQLEGESKHAVNILSENLEKVYELEKELILNENIAARGNNLFVCSKKS